MGEKITRTDWLYGFTSLYEKISPLLDRIIKDNETEPPPLDELFQTCNVLNTLLDSVKTLPKAPDRELKAIKHDLEKCLKMCISASKMGRKMVDDLNHNYTLAARMHLSSIVGYIGYAKVYKISLLDRLNKIKN